MQDVTNPISLSSILLYVVCLFPPWLYVTLLQFSHSRSNWSTPFKNISCKWRCENTGVAQRCLLLSKCVLYCLQPWTTSVRSGSMGWSATQKRRPECRSAELPFGPAALPLVMLFVLTVRSHEMFLFVFLPWLDSPTWSWASAVLRLRDHTQTPHNR